MDLIDLVQQILLSCKTMHALFRGQIILSRRSLVQFGVPQALVSSTAR